MEKVKFTWPHPEYCGDYQCDKPGDQSGEYVRAEVAEELLSALKSLRASYAKETLLKPEECVGGDFSEANAVIEKYGN